MAAPKIIAGASGFAYKPWKGPFYPDDLPDSEMLSYYAGQLPAVEINNTFYRMPKASVMEDWAAKTPAAFTFAVKASRRITHFARLKDAGDHVDYLFENLAGLGDKGRSGALPAAAQLQERPRPAQGLPRRSCRPIAG